MYEIVKFALITRLFVRVPCGIFNIFEQIYFFPGTEDASRRAKSIQPGIILGY